MTRAPAIALVALAAATFVACGSNTREVRVRSLLLISTDGRSLTVALDSCNADPVLEVAEESDDQVQLVATAERSDGGNCADVGVIKLDGPLGGRVLVDGTTGLELITDAVQVVGDPAT